MRLLLIEDDPELGARLEAALSGAGYRVDRVASGIDGEFLGDEMTYDVVVLDLGLPDRSGLEVLGHWRARHNPVPVLILTARDAWHERVDGFKAGADDYLGKPFHVEELLARLQVLVRRSNARLPSGPLQVGDLALDESTQSVTTASGEHIALTGHEFRLLRCFMLNPGRLCSKAQLQEQLYALDDDKDSNVLEVYINRLRRKLGRDRIRTRRGQGYVFDG
ncbi:MAG: response regulator transcription factor [Candidatus Competibacterales bacterium]|nr:response regulator transcription factor [Candidatus Competibacterales bacterium]